MDQENPSVKGISYFPEATQSNGQRRLLRDIAPLEVVPASAYAGVLAAAQCVALERAMSRRENTKITVQNERPESALDVTAARRMKESSEERRMVSRAEER